MKGNRKPIPRYEFDFWKGSPKRTCYSMHECCLCGERITIGQTYYDRGPRNRAHEKCVQDLFVNQIKR